MQAALHGCESWSVTAEIERHLEGSQFQQLKQILGITMTQQIDERISKAQVLQRAGAKSILFYMRCLQLTWLGKVRRMDPGEHGRLPRHLLTSWHWDSRLTNYPQTYSRTILKALASIGCKINCWVTLSKDEAEWHQYTRQTVEMRYDLRALHGVSFEDILKATPLGARGPAGLRRAEFKLCGGQFLPLPPDRFANATPVEDLRGVSVENCYDPSMDRPMYRSKSPESWNAQLMLNAGEGPYRGVRLSQNGVFYIRRQVEKASPTHRFSWMVEAEDEEKGQDPENYLTASTAPSSTIPTDRHLPTFLHYSSLVAPVVIIPEGSARLVAAPPECPVPFLVPLDQLGPAPLDLQNYFPHDPNDQQDPLGLLPGLHLPPTPPSDHDDDEGAIPDDFDMAAFYRNASLEMDAAQDTSPGAGEHGSDFSLDSPDDGSSVV